MPSGSGPDGPEGRGGFWARSFEAWRAIAWLALIWAGAPVVTTAVTGLLGVRPGAAEARLVALAVLQGALLGAGVVGARRVGARWAAPVDGSQAAAVMQAWGWALVVFGAQAVTTAATTAVLQGMGAGAGLGWERARQEQSLQVQWVRNLPGTWQAVAGLLLVGVAPLAEESFFRGYFFRALRTHAGWGFVGSAATTGLLFALLHGYAVHLPALWVSSVLLAWWYERRGYLWAPVTAHMAFNALALAVVVLAAPLAGHP